ncbi:hypothetical protein RS84_02046 [Microbacterium hydrocarbonoxydans]|uniref:Uncharacterized protein n=1 Tax=Microbacterium hydrocarbonoxydans TaxID=273678 RepID=A0A0M2HKP3_9MICO|nr:DUF3237 domain-containing protein [Microbacterium hydrocarbonoxydans]KJL47256.1 hypothetical protein RS84_02046 [Microbacterium hydrocarbonoxydans]
MPEPLMNPAFEYCFELRCRVEDALPLGGGVPGEGLHFARVSGGTVDGPRLRGAVLDSGGDWWNGRGLMVTLDARYVIAAEVVDGTAGVEVVNRGIWRADERTFQRLVEGEEVAEQDLYYRTAFVFRTEHPELAWLTESQFIGYARAEPGFVIIRVFRLI